jgi:hypothetical protein
MQQAATRADPRGFTYCPSLPRDRWYAPSIPALLGMTLNAAVLAARVKRLTALIDGLGKEAESVRTDRGPLTPQEWNRYFTALLDAKDALHAARAAVQEAATRLQTGRV